MVLSLNLRAQFFQKQGMNVWIFFSSTWAYSPRLTDMFDETNKNLQIPIANFSVCHTTCTQFLQQAQEPMDATPILSGVLGKSLLK